MVSSREAFGCISSQVQHQPGVGFRGPEFVSEYPTPTIANFLLPNHLKVRTRRRITKSTNPKRRRERNQIIGATETSFHGFDPICWGDYSCGLMVQQRLVHASLPVTWKLPWRERWYLLAILGTKPGSRVVVSILEHNHPELPRFCWGDMVCNLTQGAQVQLFLHCVEIWIIQRLFRQTREWFPDSQLVVNLSHFVDQGTI